MRTEMNDAERKIRQYLCRSAGSCNHISDHTLRCFVGMLETGEATAADFENAGGPSLKHKVWRKQGQLERQRMKEQFEREGSL